MPFQVTVQPSGHEFLVEGKDTLLEAALRAGIPLNYSCEHERVLNGTSYLGIRVRHAAIVQFAPKEK